MRVLLHAASAAVGAGVGLAAVAVHIALVGVVVRPVSWYWLIIPALFAAAGALLVALPRVDGRRGA